MNAVVKCYTIITVFINKKAAALHKLYNERNRS